MKSLLPITSLFVIALLAAAPTGGPDEILIGSKAPEIRTQDLSGKMIEWSDIEKKATILYFHSARASNSAHAFELLLADLTKDDQLLPETAVVMVVDDEAEGRKVAALLQGKGCEVRVGFSPEDMPHERYGVIAYPSVFILNAEKEVVGIVKGYGTLFGFEVVAAARFAAGLIDAAQYADLLAGGHASPPPMDAHTSRILHLARKLIVQGNLTMARTALEDLARKEQDPGPAAKLLVHVLLMQADHDEAARWIERLEADRKGDPGVAILRARLAFGTGDLERVEEILSTLDADLPGVRHVRGLMHEARGEFEAAAAAYRGALEILLLDS